MTRSEGSSLSRIATLAKKLVGAEVLIVDQDKRVHDGAAALLSAANLHVTAVTDPQEAMALVEAKFFSVMLVDLDTPTPGAGVEVIAELKQRSPTSMIIAMTPRRSFEDTLSAVRAGAIDLILKAPESVAYLKDRVLEAVGRSAGQREVDAVLSDVRTVQEEFLQRFMEAERRALDLADRLAGRDPSKSMSIDMLSVLIVDEADTLFDALEEASPPGFTFIHATSGGQGLDRVTAGGFHYAMVADDLHDLPSRMVVRSMRSQRQELVILSFSGPSDRGKVELVESAGTRMLIEPFTDPKQMIERLDELAEGYRAKSLERRYTQNFREKHYDFLRRFVDLRTKIERALNPGVG